MAGLITVVLSGPEVEFVRLWLIYKYSYSSVRSTLDFQVGVGCPAHGAATSPWACGYGIKSLPTAFILPECRRVVIVYVAHART